MEQKEFMRLLENMMKSADEMLDKVKKECDEANNPESDNYIIRDLFYENVQYFKGYKQGISNVLNNFRNYYFEEGRKNESEV